MQRVKLGTVITALAATFTNGAQGQTSLDLEVAFKIITFSQETANNLCPEPIQTSSRSTTEVNAALKAKMPTVFAKIAELSGEVGAKHVNTQTEGVLQEHLETLMKATGECRYKVFESLKAEFFGGNPPSIKANTRISPSAPLVNGAPLDNAEVSVPTDTQGPVIRVFPKANLTLQEAIVLAKLLPNYSVQIGKSTVDTSMYADTLFVNRDKVQPNEVIEAARALNKVGVPIKTIQQAPVGGRREIQVGTMLNESGQEHENIKPLDLEKLANLKGVNLWVAAYNGATVGCRSELGFYTPCQLDQSGRPVLIE